MQIGANHMAILQNLAQAQAEIDALKVQLALANRPKAITMKVSEKGALSFYALARFPTMPLPSAPLSRPTRRCFPSSPSPSHRTTISLGLVLARGRGQNFVSRRGPILLPANCIDFEKPILFGL